MKTDARNNLSGARTFLVLFRYPFDISAFLCRNYPCYPVENERVPKFCADPVPNSYSLKLNYELLLPDQFSLCI